MSYFGIPSSIISPDATAFMAEQQAMMAEVNREIENQKRNYTKKLIDRIPQMSDRELLEGIYKLLLQQE